jgi:hypothetical protein
VISCSHGNKTGNIFVPDFAGWDFANVWYMGVYPQLREFVESSDDEYQLWAFDSGAPA